MNHTKQGRRASRLAFYGARSGPLVLPPSLFRARRSYGYAAELRYAARDGTTLVVPVTLGAFQFIAPQGTSSSATFRCDGDRGTR